MSKAGTYPILNFDLISALPETAKQIYRTQGFKHHLTRIHAFALTSASCFGTCQSTRLAPPSPARMPGTYLVGRHRGAVQYVLLPLACALSEEIPALTCVPSYLRWRNFLTIEYGSFVPSFLHACAKNRHNIISSLSDS